MRCLDQICGRLRLVLMELLFWAESKQAVLATTGLHLFVPS
jgi:hypothetical protein